MEELSAREQLMDLVFLGLDHGIESIKDGGGPLIPFVLIESAVGERDIKRFVADELEQAETEARAHLSGLTDAERVALVYDGYVTVENDRTDAVLVEAQERGQTNSLIFAQPYRPGGRLRKLAPIGNAAFLGEGEPVL
jgi:hypothetical protein